MFLLLDKKNGYIKDAKDAPFDIDFSIFTNWEQVEVPIVSVKDVEESIPIPETRRNAAEKIEWRDGSAWRKLVIVPDYPRKYDNGVVSITIPDFVANLEIAE